ncbi:MAG: hypothetical protein PHH08_03745 [Candidatus ainarchaeum sp.]|nr:hypothetical protein [Candidatus ainarchaeum sp.]
MFSKKSRGQAALEYLMTYGWALVIIVTVASVLFFVLQQPASEVRFSVDSRDFLVRSSNVNPVTRDFIVELQNKSGRNMTGATVTGNFPIFVDSGFSNLPMRSGEIIKITGNMGSYSDSGSLNISYSSAGYAKTAKLNAQGKIPGTTGAQLCGNGALNPGEECDGSVFSPAVLGNLAGFCEFHSMCWYTSTPSCDSSCRILPASVCAAQCPDGTCDCI